MKINRKGSTRIVIEFQKIVVKIPNFLGEWVHFLNGILSNINENRTWKYNSGEFEEGKSYLLCPVIWCSFGGWILVMKKVDRLIDDINLFDFKEHIKYFKGDDSIYNYGILNGKLVKIDYGSLNDFDLEI